MVQGLDVFRGQFEGCHGRHVIIGGTACNLVYARYGAPERATQDIDLVVLADAFDDEYYRRFIEFVHEASYEHRTRDGRYELYRFSNPASDNFPAMVELLSRRPEVLLGIERTLGRFQTVDGHYSLSAILLDDDYYEMLSVGVEFIDGLPVLGLRHLPVFKMHAWINLSKEKEAGNPVHNEEIRKHRSDVCKLCALINPGVRVELADAVRDEVAEFCAAQPWDDNMLHMWRIPLDALGMRRHIEGIYLQCMRCARLTLDADITDEAALVLAISGTKRSAGVKPTFAHGVSKQSITEHKVTRIVLRPIDLEKADGKAKKWEWVVESDDDELAEDAFAVRRHFLCLVDV